MEIRLLEYATRLKISKQTGWRRSKQGKIQYIKGEAKNKSDEATQNSFL
jgi:hypothetical protein